MTGSIYCRPGGVAIFAPDCVCETFVLQTDHGGHVGQGDPSWVVLADPEGNEFCVLCARVD